MRIVVVTPSMSSNSLGRTYVHWELCRRAGWDVRVIAADRGAVWAPMESTEFGRSVLDSSRIRAVIEFAPDVIVCVKPLIESMRLARDISSRTAAPVVVDIDDPDLSATLALGSPARAFAKRLFRGKAMKEATTRRQRAESGHVLVSNPILQKAHGGTIIPHARDLGEAGADHVSSSPVVAFVGTNRDHKGIPELREVIARLHAEEGFTLVVTDDPPSDARPWENWVGQTSFGEGMALLRRADIVALPSRRVPFAHGQLPAKLIDAMFAARAIVVSDVAPLPWALGDAGLVFRAGHPEELYERLKALRDPELRRHHGGRARELAIDAYSFDALARRYEQALLGALTPAVSGIRTDPVDPSGSEGAPQ